MLYGDEEYRMRLICLPYAGGDSRSYVKWRKIFQNRLEMVAINYAGRGKRIREGMITTYQDNIYDIFSIVKNYINNEYAILGHSMGAIYAYELVRMIEKNNLRRPVKVFLSGARAPHVLNQMNISELSKDDFMLQMYKLGGIPKELMCNDLLIDLFYPILYSDVRNLEMYKQDKMGKTPERIGVPIVIFYGNRDPEFSVKDVGDWDLYGGCPNVTYEFDGGHFFVLDNAMKVCQQIMNILL